MPSERRVTVVTGGGRGIGAATATRLAADGHDLVLVYRRDAGAAEATAEAAVRFGVRCTTVRADVTREDDVARLFAHAMRTYGRVTGVVNNAGMTGSVADLAETPTHLVRTVVEANLVGALLCARQAVRAMSTRYGGEGGAIVNVGSVAASTGSPHEYVHYAAAKAGVEAMTVGLAKEVAGEGIRVNAVSPGTVLTGIHADAGDPDRPARVAARIPLRRAGRPEEIAPAIAWLLGDEASYTTGAVLRVAGGL